MEKEIPNSQEKTNRATRLRETVRRLREDFDEKPPTEKEWDAVTGDLSLDDLAHLRKLARGHLDRALGALGDGEADDAFDEAVSALRLQPRDPAWAREAAQALRAAGFTGPKADALLGATGKKPGRPLRWIIPLTAVLLLGSVAAVLALFTWSPSNFGVPSARPQGPRTLDASFDTQGVKTNIEVAQSRLLIFPESTVAEISAWVTFPDHRVDLWEGSVSLLDSQGQALARREVTFRAASDGPLDPGQGIAVFQQFDAWPWFDKVASFQVTTSRILAQEAHPRDRKEMTVGGIEALTAGYSLKAWVQDSRWSDRFASKVHSLSLEFENTGLKPFAELQFALVWRDSLGKTLKTVPFRPVSAFRTALPPGGRLSWAQETVFDTEVFSWPAGSEPLPVLELRRWQ